MINACHYVTSTDSPSKIAMGDVLSRPTDLPATPAERRVAGHLVIKILSQTSDEEAVKVPTSGQVR